MIAEVFTGIASGLTSFVTSFFEALLGGFTTLFLTEGGTPESPTTELSPLGDIAIVFIVMGIVYKILPTVVGWFRLRASARRKGKRKASR